MPLPARHRRDIGFSIAVDLGDVIPPGGLTREEFPHLARAVEKIVQASQAQWVRFAMGAPLPGGKTITNRTGAYARSILYRMSGDFAGEAYSELPYAAVIEEGGPSYDAKRILGSSYKVRVTKKGERYLIIPFRHYHPSSVMGSNMPQAVHDWWQAEQRENSRVLRKEWRESGTGAWDVKTRAPMLVPARKYIWGARLTKAAAEGLGLSPEVARRMAGMVRFRKPQGTGYGAHSQHITFRVMKESSKGWIVPAREGMHPARETSDLLRPVAEESFRRAVERDVGRYLGGDSSD